MLPGSSRQRDVYAHLLRDTRGLRRDQASAREAWYASLPWGRKEETLFELEMLLKGIACFGNPRNHPGPPRRSPGVAHDFHEELRILREATDRSVTLVRTLLGEKDRAYTFTRYLESVLPDDTERSRLVQEQLTQDTPIEALFVLRNGLSGMVEMIDGLLRLGRVSNRLFHAAHGQLVREIGRNAFFNPLVTLEFRAEFDRIRITEVLEALDNVPSEAAHRVVSLTFLTLFRSLRYLDLIDGFATERTTMRLGYVMLAVLRSDLRALTRFIGQRSSDVIADGFEKELLEFTSRDITEHYQPLAHIAAQLVTIRGTLETLANTLRIEARRAYERELPPVEETARVADLGASLVLTAAGLRATVHHAIAVLCADLRPGQPAPALAKDDVVRRAASARLRQDIWMFARILRAFIAKAKATRTDTDEWRTHASFQFGREFLRHFRAIGYQLLRSNDYDRLDPMLRALESLRDVDLLDPQRLERAVQECISFYSYLEQLFAQVDRRSELADSPFDKKAAAEVLKIYLGAA